MKYLKLFVFVCLLFEITSTENEKRILLNDPDMMNARMDGLQHEIQAMKSELQNLKTQRSNQGTAHARANMFIIKIYLLNFCWFVRKHLY